LLTLLRVLQTVLLKEQRQKAALAAAHEQITGLDHFRKEMLANVSHDLRTPVTNISGFAETLLQKPDLTAAEQKRYLDIIIKSAKRMDAMISEIFDLSKLEARQITLKKEPFNLAELAQDILYAQSEQASSKQVRLLTEFQEELPQLEADIFWIDRVLQNLLTNAFKHVNDGGLIKVSIFTENDLLHLKVCNSGTPIEQEHLAYIFDRYFKSSNHQSGGTGLGLAIAHKIVALHGGNIWAEVSGDITTFRFSLQFHS
jgi:signal transduction histidine kinase